MNEHQFAGFADIINEASVPAKRRVEPTFPPEIEAAAEAITEAKMAARSRGRPATGKRSDPAFEKSGVLIRKETKKRTAMLLLNYPKKDFSDLVDELLTTWNNRHTE